VAFKTHCAEFSLEAADSLAGARLILNLARVAADCKKSLILWIYFAVSSSNSPSLHRRRGGRARWWTGRAAGAIFRPIHIGTKAGTQRDRMLTQLFAWWDSTTYSTELTLLRRGARLVGKDEQGKRYYE
jgi:hypothetical protein